MNTEIKTKIKLIEQQITQTHSTLQTWTKEITHYQALLENLTKQLQEIKNKLTK